MRLARRPLTELDVVALEVEDLGAAKDGHVLKLGLSDRGAVVRDDDELGLALSQALHRGLVTCERGGGQRGERARGTYRPCTCQT